MRKPKITVPVTIDASDMRKLLIMAKLGLKGSSGPNGGQYYKYCKSIERATESLENEIGFLKSIFEPVDAGSNQRCYFIRFKADGNGFSGWNSVHANGLKDARMKLLAKIGQKLYNEIDWATLKTGKSAEKADSQMEKAYGGCFD